MAYLATKRAVEGCSIRLEAPFIHLTKAGIIRLGLELGVDYSPTVSCYQADTGPVAIAIPAACGAKVSMPLACLIQRAIPIDP